MNMTHFEEMYNKLLVSHEAQIKQYERLQQKYDDVMVLTKRYSDHMKYCLSVLEEENKELKRKLDNVKELMRKYENEAN